MWVEVLIMDDVGIGFVYRASLELKVVSRPRLVHGIFSTFRTKGRSDTGVLVVTTPAPIIYCNKYLMTLVCAQMITQFLDFFRSVAVNPAS
jgi:hypothetical protein